MLIILCGLSGAGKSYLGEIFKNEFGFFYWDADQNLSVEMRQSINNKELFTQAMRNELTDHLITKIAELQKHHNNIVIAQALYKEQNRQQILLAFPAAHLIWVQASENNIRKRLQNRNNGIDYSYAQKIKENFEIPQLPHRTLTNDSDDQAIIDQLEVLLEINSKNI